MHETIINGHKRLVADTMEEAFNAWFSPECACSMIEIFNAPTEPRRKCVYLVEFNNGWCKIGVAKDFDKRLKTITSSSGASPIRWCHTHELPNKDAFKIESKCHRKFAPYRLEGEFFNIPYEDARTELSKYAKLAGQA